MITDSIVMWENSDQHCRLGLFQDSDFAADLEDSKSTSVRILCPFGSRTFVPISWMCMKQTSVSHSSTESEIISLDDGLRMNGIVALDLWDVAMEVLHSSKNKKSSTQEAAGSCLHMSNVKLKKKGNQNVDQVSHLNHVTTNQTSFQCEAQLYIFEDEEAVIKMIIKGRSPMMRHVSRTHRVALDWLFDRINLDPKFPLEYVDTNN